MSMFLVNSSYTSYKSLNTSQEGDDAIYSHLFYT